MYMPATHQAVVAQAVPERVEGRVRLAALAKRVRTTEFFKDFDKLRTGYITSEYVVCDRVCVVFVHMYASDALCMRIINVVHVDFIYTTQYPYSYPIHLLLACIGFRERAQ